MEELAVDSEGSGNLSRSHRVRCVPALVVMPAVCPGGSLLVSVLALLFSGCVTSGHSLCASVSMSPEWSQ